MSNPNETHPYNYPTSSANDFERWGHPGKWHGVIACEVGETIFTGSNFGVGGLLVNRDATGMIYLSKTGSITIEEVKSLTIGIATNGAVTTSLYSYEGSNIVELSPYSINVTAGKVYALLRNQVIR